MSWHRHPRHVYLGPPRRDQGDDPGNPEFAKEINPQHDPDLARRALSRHVLYKQAKENGWLYNEEIDLLTERGHADRALNYPHLSHTEIFRSVEDFYKKF